ncbi:glycoside hydrolase/deacetylase [Exidia glandulosa HHB12029]|uniref:Glycoside hydrolase/deacetylase n=1 Tax=Exidia glandulosa HHB12029 TaxID=1314781 RepID=A0A165EWM7_EXIGL|nr:glycoside hydrolase/deacetylase [Exidia glandulosa HHB12029]
MRTLLGSVLSLSTLTGAVYGPSYLSAGSTLPSGTIVRSCTRPGTAALTFDDGPHIYTSRLIESLNSIGAKATFFVCGDLYGCIYDLDRTRILEKAFYSGHQIASHTWSHPALDTLAASDLTEEMTRLEAAFDRILGVRPRWMRPPYGRVNGTVQAALRDMDYRIALWDADSEDWNRRTPQQSLARLTKSSSAHDAGFVALMHDPIEGTSLELGVELARWAQARGLRLVTLSECLGEHQPDGQYERLGSPQLRDENWSCRGLAK